MRPALAVPLLAAVALLAGCGDDSGATAEDATSAAATSATPSTASPSGKPVSSQKTCAELYHPPAQLMPRAIEFVHGSPSAEESDAASDLVAGLGAAEGHALEPLAADIAVTREGVESKVAGDQPAMSEFDHAVNRLASHCELHND